MVGKRSTECSVHYAIFVFKLSFAFSTATGSRKRHGSGSRYASIRQSYYVVRITSPEESICATGGSCSRRTRRSAAARKGGARLVVAEVSAGAPRDAEARSHPPRHPLNAKCIRLQFFIYRLWKTPYPIISLHYIFPMFNFLQIITVPCECRKTATASSPMLQVRCHSRFWPLSNRVSTELRKTMN